MKKKCFGGNKSQRDVVWAEIAARAEEDVTPSTCHLPPLSIKQLLEVSRANLLVFHLEVDHN